MSSQNLSLSSEVKDDSRVVTKPDRGISNWHFAALFLIICALFVLRRPDSVTNPQFWAEDGLVLFQGQLLHGGMAWIFEPYKGYLIVNTKLIAAFGALFPVLYAPLIYDVFAILIASLACSMFALRSYRHLVRSDMLRVLACLGATGALYTESLVDNACNSQWYLALIGLLLLFRAPPRGDSYWKTGAIALAACLTALTSPVLAITAPICLWQLASKQNRSAAAGMLTGIIVQIGFFLFYPAATMTAQVRPGAATLVIAVAVATVYKVVIASLFGWRTVWDVSNASSNLIFLFISIGTAVWLVWLFARIKSAQRVQMAVALYLIAASIALPLSARGEYLAYRTATHILQPRGEQYFFIAGCMLLFLIALTVERTIPPQWKYIQGAAFVLVVAGGFFENFRVPPFVDFQWPQHARAIEAWEAGRIAIFASGVVIPLNPPSLFIRLPAVFGDITVTGFPDHIRARSIEGEDRPISIAPSFMHDSGKLEYIDLPLVLGSDTRYMVSAVLRSQGSAVVSLLVHGRIEHGARMETPPTSVVDDSQIRTEVRTDSDGSLCIHLERLSGAQTEFRSITLHYLPN